jgi:hypothetical protein
MAVATPARSIFRDGVLRRPALRFGSKAADRLGDLLKIIGDITRRINMVMHVDDVGRWVCNFGSGRRGREYCRSPNDSDTRQEIAPRAARASRNITKAAAAIAKA